MTVSTLAAALPWALAGAVLGAAYFTLLARSVAAIGAAADWRRVAGHLVVRLGLAGGGFVLAAMQGAAALLLMLAGFLLARGVAIRRAGRD